VTVDAPVLPPLTGTIVFVSERSGRRDLWQTDLTTGVVTQLTANFRFHSRPEVSPTGDRIVFADNAGRGTDCRLRREQRAIRDRVLRLGERG
jgi:Tol biopolymer transport system component